MVNDKLNNKAGSTVKEKNERLEPLSEYNKNNRSKSSNKKQDRNLSESVHTKDDKNDNANSTAHINNGKNIKKNNVTVKTKRTGKKSHCKLLAVIIVFAAVVSVGVLFAYGVLKKYNSELMNDGSGNQKIDVVIGEGETVKSIAMLLEQEGVIDSSNHFLYLCKKNNIGTDFHAGSYTFSDNLTFKDLVNMLQTGSFNSENIRFTVIEGQWMTEIAQNAEQLGICTADEFLKECNSRDYDYDFINAIPQRDKLLEGYLYPDTYFIKRGTTAHELVNILLSGFDNAIGDDYIAHLEDNGVTLDDAVIMASLIENEVRYPAERNIVASVIYNRLNEGMKMQIDATVLYALGEKKSQVLYSDLEVEDEHNTYYVSGLPIGPIGNPGLDCLNAAAYPADTDYLYYVLDDAETGQHYFTDDYDDFLEAKERYNSSLD